MEYKFCKEPNFKKCSAFYNSTMPLYVQLQVQKVVQYKYLYQCVALFLKQFEDQGKLEGGSKNTVVDEEYIYWETCVRNHFWSHY